MGGGYNINSLKNTCINMFQEMCLPKIKQQSSQNHSLQTCITPGRPDLLFHNVCGTPNSILFLHGSADCSAWRWQAGNPKLMAEFQSLLCPPGLTPFMRATLFQHKAQRVATIEPGFCNNIQPPFYAPSSLREPSQLQGLGLEKEAAGGNNDCSKANPFQLPHMVYEWPCDPLLANEK